MASTLISTLPQLPCLEDGTKINATSTPLLLDGSRRHQLKKLSETIHDLVSRLLEVLALDAALYREVFPDHSDLRNCLRDTLGTTTKLLVCRYDIIIDTLGIPQLLELNSACPAGFSLDAKLRDGPAPPNVRVVDTPDLLTELVSFLLSLEAAAGLSPAGIAYLYDENELHFEEAELLEAFRRRGRHALSFAAKDLVYDGQRLLAAGTPLSLTLNKFRISYPSSQHHCWRIGYLERYRAFLEAQKAGRVVSVNNLWGLLVAENKELLALFHRPNLRSTFTTDERKFIDRHIPWTLAIKDLESSSKVVYEGEVVSLAELVESHRSELVVKPSGEGRGYGVHLGRECDPVAWRDICLNQTYPMVLQRYVAPTMVEAACDGATTAEGYTQVLGLCMLGGRFSGVLSRVSQSSVANVHRQAMPQPVFWTE